MGPEQVDEIFSRTLTGEYDDESSWEAVRTLHRTGGRQVCDRAAEWCRSDDPLKRARGADVIAQLGRTVEHPSNNFPEECFSVVSTLVQREKDPLPLLSAAHALGHIGNPLAVPLLITLKFKLLTLNFFARSDQSTGGESRRAPIPAGPTRPTYQKYCAGGSSPSARR
jgi:hypothetical protein